MGIIRLTLFSVVALGAAMVWFGRDEGLPETRIGRAPNTESLSATTSVSSIGARTQAEADPAVATSSPAIAPVPAGDVAAIPAAITPADPATGAIPLRRPAARPQQRIETDPLEAAVTEALSAAETAAPAAVAAPASTAPVMLYVTGNEVNLRTGPSTRFAKVGKVTRGQALIDMGDAGDGWRMVGLPAGATAYMSTDFLSSTPQ